MPPYTKPFSIAWLSGVGLTVNAPDDTPTPTHAVDLIVTNTTDRVVFDSTEATGFDQYVWGDVYKIFVWQDPVQVCRLVVHAAWPPTGDITPHEYELHILPTDGKLDDRTLARLPDDLTVVLDTLDGVQEPSDMTRSRKRRHGHRPARPDGRQATGERRRAQRIAARRV